MEKLKKEFILNTFVISMVLALISGWIGAKIVVNHSVLSNRDDWVMSFFVLFLILYAFNLAMSIVNYVIAKMVGNFILRLLIFNILGLIIAVIAWVFKGGSVFLATLIYSTFIVFSIMALVINQSKGKPQK
ncbi:hypothetical protein [Paenibacillus gallinarum]|uniref:Phage holin family protein n=1 Tax=Paenibacillus gallinarum TaxID=2762232 RepID=A0ABR8SU56_9BACL|nr:hypothetical protein [Paenibacillus gallinarum]MBD7966659.1 hypothetical protein [Paenibacillus gallinarum]